MQLHNLQPSKKSRKVRVGRGGKRGTYSGRGIKGQKSRAGRRIRPAVRDVIKRIPKKKGYRMKRFKQKAPEVNAGPLEAKNKNEEKVTPLTLRAKGLIRGNLKKSVTIKLLGSGKLTKKLLVEHCQLSKSADSKVKKAGGSVLEQ